MPYRSVNIDDVILIARRAGAEIMAMRPLVIGNPVTKMDGSPVTEADKRSSDIVIKGLATLTPATPVVSEEMTSAEHKAILAAHDTYWIVDPLDGTRSYIDGHDGFGVHIGMIVKGQPTMAVIYFPAQGLLYFTDGVNGAYRQEDGKQPERIEVNSKIQAGRVPSVAVSWYVTSRPSEMHCAYEAVPAVGGGRICLTAEGKTDLAMIEVPFSYWDVAAAHGLIRAAGGDLYALSDGRPIDYPADRLHTPPAIAGHADIVDACRADFVVAMDAARAAKKKNAAFKP